MASGSITITLARGFYPSRRCGLPRLQIPFEKAWSIAVCQLLAWGTRRCQCLGEDAVVDNHDRDSSEPRKPAVTGLLYESGWEL